jgi:YesN/AraC family two-component response regulator
MPDEAFRLLIADDEYWVRHAIETLIDWPAYGFECLPAAQDGEDAWEKIRALHPHIVLLDVNMPFLSGIELTERLHQQYPEIAVLMLSGYSEYAYVREAMRNGAIDYLLKPVERDKLLTALSLATGHLLQRQAERQKLDALREKSELAISLLKDRELSQLLQTAGKDAADPRTLFYELQFAGYQIGRAHV